MQKKPPGGRPAENTNNKTQNVIGKITLLPQLSKESRQYLSTLYTNFLKLYSLVVHIPVVISNFKEHLYFYSAQYFSLS